LVREKNCNKQTQTKCRQLGEKRGRRRAAQKWMKTGETVGEKGNYSPAGATHHRGTSEVKDIANQTPTLSERERIVTGRMRRIGGLCAEH